MNKIIAITNQKGGVGKTTSAINLASGLAVLDKKVLVLDLDPQANCSSGLGYTSDKIKVSVYDLLINNTPLQDIILPSEVDNLKLAPAHIDLVGIEQELHNIADKEMILKSSLCEVKDEYEYIIIDCAPSLGLLTINALAAADSVIIPVQCEYYALEGLEKLLNTISIIKAGLNTNLEIEGILMTMYDSRLKLSNQVVGEIKKHFSDLTFDTIIPRNVKLGEAPSFGKPSILYSIESAGTISYLNLANELLEKTESNHSAEEA